MTFLLIAILIHPAAYAGHAGASCAHHRHQWGGPRHAVVMCAERQLVATMPIRLRPW